MLVQALCAPECFDQAAPGDTYTVTIEDQQYAAEVGTATNLPFLTPPSDTPDPCKPDPQWHIGLGPSYLYNVPADARRLPPFTDLKGGFDDPPDRRRLLLVMDDPEEAPEEAEIEFAQPQPSVTTVCPGGQPCSASVGSSSWCACLGPDYRSACQRLPLGCCSDCIHALPAGDAAPLAGRMLAAYAHGGLAADFHLQLKCVALCNSKCMLSYCQEDAFPALSQGHAL